MNYTQEQLEHALKWARTGNATQNDIAIIDAELIKLRADLAAANERAEKAAKNSTALYIRAAQADDDLAARDETIAGLVAAGDSLYALANAWAAHHSSAYNKGTIHPDHLRFLHEWKTAKSAAPVSQEAQKEGGK